MPLFTAALDQFFDGEPNLKTIVLLQARGEIREGTTMNFDQMTDQQLWDIANPIMDNLMEASTRIDHAAHTRDFTDRVRRIVTPEHLENVCKQYQAEKGFFTDRSPVVLFRRPSSVAFIWRQRFSKAPGDFVAEIVLMKEGDRYLVDHALVF